MTHPTAFQEPGAPPEPPHRRHARITFVLFALWLGLTLGSRPLAPLIAKAVDAVEVALGLDVSRGTGEL